MTSARPIANASRVANHPLNRSLSDANFNKLGLKRLICTGYDGSPLAGQMTLFDEYNAGNGQCRKPKAISVIVDHVKDENNDGAADIENVKLFLRRSEALYNNGGPRWD